MPLLMELFIAHTVREIYEIYEIEYKLNINPFSTNVPLI